MHNYHRIYLHNYTHNVVAVNRSSNYLSADKVNYYVCDKLLPFDRDDILFENILTNKAYDFI
jgi:hypothetical protein